MRADRTFDAVRLLRPLALAGAMLAVTASPALADGLTAPEQVRLARGEPVSRPQVSSSGERRRYVGGVTYEIVDATPRDLGAVLDDVTTWRRILPSTRDDARRVGERGPDPLVQVTHGSALVQVAYTLQ